LDKALHKWQQATGVLITGLKQLQLTWQEEEAYNKLSTVRVRAGNLSVRI